jgi:hypothetical protein
LDADLVTDLDFAEARTERGSEPAHGVGRAVMAADRHQ